MKAEMSFRALALRRSVSLSCSDEGLTLETSVQNHFHGVKLIYINLKLLHYTFILYADAD